MFAICEFISPESKDQKPFHENNFQNVEYFRIKRLGMEKWKKYIKNKRLKKKTNRLLVTGRKFVMWYD